MTILIITITIIIVVIMTTTISITIRHILIITEAPTGAKPTWILCRCALGVTRASCLPTAREASGKQLLYQAKIVEPPR